jgi:hypothetical protein
MNQKMFNAKARSSKGAKRKMLCFFPSSPLCVEISYDEPGHTGRMIGHIGRNAAVVAQGDGLDGL